MQQCSSPNLVSRQLKLYDIFIFGIAHWDVTSLLTCLCVSDFSRLHDFDSIYSFLHRILHVQQVTSLMKQTNKSGKI